MSYFMSVLIVRITEVTLRKKSITFLMIQNEERSYILQSSQGSTRVRTLIAMDDM